MSAGILLTVNEIYCLASINENFFHPRKSLQPTPADQIAIHIHSSMTIPISPCPTQNKKSMDISSNHDDVEIS